MVNWIATWSESSSHVTSMNSIVVHAPVLSLTTTMPIIDPRLGIYVQDTKPTRICRWRECPLVGSDYEGVKLKACARCNFVRYCVSILLDPSDVVTYTISANHYHLKSKECQKSDWPTHKKGCRVPQFVDIGSWIRVSPLNLISHPSPSSWHAGLQMAPEMGSN